MNKEQIISDDVITKKNAWNFIDQFMCLLQQHWYM
jgi:hypothetical protein